MAGIAAASYCVLAAAIIRHAALQPIVNVHGVKVVFCMRLCPARPRMLLSWQAHQLPPAGAQTKQDQRHCSGMHAVLLVASKLEPHHACHWLLPMPGAREHAPI